MTRTIGEFSLCRDCDGKAIYYVGNAAVVFEVEQDGVRRMLKCYLRTNSNLRRIYGGRLHEKELFVFTDEGGAWCDVLLDDWTEGEDLASLMRRLGAKDMGVVAAAFDRLGCAMLRSECAHGDIKPENIIVRPDGEMRLIDFDGAFMPEFAGQPSPELGTAAYQHPQRSARIFDASIDDYSIALISVGLHAAALDEAFCRECSTGDMPFDTRRTIEGKDAALNRAADILASNGDAVHYRIARMLATPCHALPALAPLMEYAVAAKCAVQGLAAEYSHGLWGFSLDGKQVIPPLYDAAFDFSEGLAAVSLAGRWFFIDPCGRVRIDCRGCSAVKPFRNGIATVVRDGLRHTIKHPDDRT